MQLPSRLRQALEIELEKFSFNTLTDARAELTKSYRQANHSHPHIITDAQRLSYAVTRLPATYAAISHALATICHRAPNLKIESLLDLGAGPGTTCWAMHDMFSMLQTITAFERDPALIALGQRLAADAGPAINWQQGDLEQISSVQSADCIILSYAINELSPTAIAPLIELCWHAAQQLLLIVEPGTPAGFERIRQVRSQLLNWGGHLIAPCPHQATCPMTDGDWCHFAARVERTSAHRRLKGGTLGYEDEKFSYVAATKQPYPFPIAHVLSRPEQHGGHTKLKLCTAPGVQYVTVSKRDKEAYRIARRLEWGDDVDECEVTRPSRP